MKSIILNVVKYLAIYVIFCTLFFFLLSCGYNDNTWMVRDGHELKWDKNDLPLDCFFLPEMTNDLMFAYEEARIEMNEAVGLQLFLKCVPWRIEKIPKRPVNGSIMLGLYKNRDKYGGTAALFYNKRTGQIDSVKILIRFGLKDITTHQVIMHELGHSLGLEHDNVYDSIMNKNNSEFTNDLTLHDVNLLRDTYSK